MSEPKKYVYKSVNMTDVKFEPWKSPPTNPILPPISTPPGHIPRIPFSQNHSSGSDSSLSPKNDCEEASETRPRVRHKELKMWARTENLALRFWLKSFR